MTDSGKVYQEDHKFAQQLLSGDDDAWERFYCEFRKKLEAYISRKYPDVFSDIAIEEIFDGVGKRLIEHDYKALRDYRGECSFSAYITKATEWEIRDWLRKHSEELMNESIDTIGYDDKSLKVSESPKIFSFAGEKEELPEPIKFLNDDLRFAFLLRYYDYFGFPFDEMRLLAKKKGVSIGSITEKIVNLLEPSGQDVLQPQREKQHAFQQRLEKICYEIHKLTLKKNKLDCAEHYGSDRTAKFLEISEKRSELGKKREGLLKETAKFIITTPYEVIAEILGESNSSTIRSRVFLAKKQLAGRISVREAQDISK